MRILSLPPFVWLLAMQKKFEDWANVPIFHYKGNDPNNSPYTQAEIEIRRIDVLLMVMGIGIALFYWLFYSWQWAVLGTLFYIMVVMMALWMF